MGITHINIVRTLRSATTMNQPSFFTTLLIDLYCVYIFNNSSSLEKYCPLLTVLKGLEVTLRYAGDMEEHTERRVMKER